MIESLSTDSNGPLPGTGRVRRRLRLRGSRAVAVPPDDHRLADVRRAACQRAFLTQRLEGGTSSFDEGRCVRSPPLQGSESNRQGPAHEAGSGANPPCKAMLSTRRESNPPRRLGRPVPTPIGHACTRAPSGNRTRSSDLASQRAAANTLSASNIESRAGIEPARAPGCSRWPYRLGDLDKRASGPGIGSPPRTRDRRTRRRRRESNSRSACARRRSGPVCRTDRHLVSTNIA
jgi:hypothetical protein